MEGIQETALDSSFKSLNTSTKYHIHRIYVSNLDFKVTRDILSETFSKYGDVLHVHMPGERSRNSKGMPTARGIAFISFSSAAEVNKAVRDCASGIQILQRKAFVKPAQPKDAPKKEKVNKNIESDSPAMKASELMKNEIKITGLQKYTNKQSLCKHFSQFGEISRVFLPMNSFKKRPGCKGFAHISFKTEEGVRAALKQEKQVIETSEVTVSKSSSSLSNSASHAKFGVAVFGIQPSTRRDVFKAIMSTYGEVTDVVFPDENRRGKCAPAIVDYATEEGQKAALKKGVLKGTGGKLRIVPLKSPSLIEPDDITPLEFNESAPTILSDNKETKCGDVNGKEFALPGKNKRRSRNNRRIDKKKIALKTAIKSMNNAKDFSAADLGVIDRSASIQKIKKFVNVKSPRTKKVKRLGK